MPHFAQKSSSRTDAETHRNCQEIVRQLGFIAQELDTLKIERTRIVNSLNHHRARETDARRRQREIEQDRPSPDADRPNRRSPRRKSATALAGTAAPYNESVDQKSIRRFIGRIISTVADSALFANWVNRVRQAEAEANSARNGAAHFQSRLDDIDRLIDQKTQNRQTYRQNWARMSCSTALGRRFPDRY
ncbi:hypothetical protein [Pyruvatibacter sp.]